MGRKLGLMFALFCVGTVLTQGMLFGYLASTGKLNKERIGRMIEVAQGIEPDPAGAAKSAKDVEKTKKEKEPPSFDEMDQVRSLKLRLYDLRELNLGSATTMMTDIKKFVETEKDNHNKLHTNFINALDEINAKKKTEGRDTIRELWEKGRPKWAKEHMLRMIEENEKDDVVAIFAAIPINQRVKIASEFKTEEEAEKLADILRRIRQGYPDTTLLNKTKNELEQFKTDEK